MWERGLKYAYRTVLRSPQGVAPLVGAWIEIILLIQDAAMSEVAPLVGAWIEIL